MEGSGWLVVDNDANETFFIAISIEVLKDSLKATFCI